MTSHLAVCGLDNGGELGLGYYGPPVLTPEPATTFGEDEFVGIALGGVSYALRDDGTVLASGVGEHGGLGQGNRENSATAGVVPFAKPVVKIAAAGMHMIALHQDGTVSTLGDNEWGTIGNGAWGEGSERQLEHDALTPYLIPSITDAVDVYAGGAVCAVLLADESVLAWGENTFGQLGDGTKVAKSVPTKVLLPNGVKVAQVAIGGQASIETHILYLLTDGTLLGSGARHEGQLIILGTGQRVPVHLGINEVTEVWAGQGVSYAKLDDGSLIGWGKNNQYALAAPIEGAIYGPRSILPAIEALAIGFHYCVALTPEGVKVWGRNDYGELGDGTKIDKPLPRLLPIVRPSMIASGSWHTFFKQAGVLGPAKLTCVPGKRSLTLTWVAPTAASAYRWRILHRIVGTTTWTGAEYAGSLRTATVTGLTSGVQYEVSLYNPAWGSERMTAYAL